MKNPRGTTDWRGTPTTRKEKASRRSGSRWKLTFDRTPMMATTPLRNVAKGLWARIRRRLLQEHGMVCMACGYVPPAVGELEGHEVHSFPGGGVIRLEVILLLCRKCHHAVHLERSVSWARDRARWKWEEEHPLPGRRRTRSSEEMKAMAAAADKAASEYLDEMLSHYCKVNRVTVKQRERDFENAVPPEDIMQLREADRAAWKEQTKSDPELLHMIVPVFGRARMDYGPFADEFALVEKRRALAQERREQRELQELDDPEITRLWNSMTPEQRREFADVEEFAFRQWDEGPEDQRLYQWPYGPIE